VIFRGDAARPRRRVEIHRSIACRGSIWDPASLHRYNYARSNPVNYIDPSGRDALSEFALNLGRTTGEDTLAIINGGIQVACNYFTIASMIQLLADGPTASQEQRQLLSASFNAHVSTCAAQVKWALAFEGAGLALGVAAKAFGPWLEDLWQGFRPCCFAAGTEVYTDHGPIPIERIIVGDKVLAENRRTGEREYKTVTALTPQHRDQLVEIHIEGEREALKPSVEHPFWVWRSTLAAPAWIDAANMLAGDEVLTATGQWRKVLSVAVLPGLAVVYNLEVDKDHDYFVGKQELLVHNALCPIPKGGAYVLVDEEGNVWRTGKTNNFDRRAAEHLRDELLKDLTMVRIFPTDSYAAQRGLEQILYDVFPDAQFNFMNGINPNSANMEEYIQAALNYLNGLI